MTTFKSFSRPTRKLLKRALEYPDFRAEFFAKRDTLSASFGIPEDNVQLLQQIFFAGIQTEADLYEKLSRMADAIRGAASSLTGPHRSRW